MLIHIHLLLGILGEDSGAPLEALINWEYSSLFKGRGSLMQRLVKEDGSKVIEQLNAKSSIRTYLRIYVVHLVNIKFVDLTTKMSILYYIAFKQWLPYLTCMIYAIGIKCYRNKNMKQYKQLVSYTHTSL